MKMNLLKRLMQGWFGGRRSGPITKPTVGEKKYQWISALYGKICSTLWMVFFSLIEILSSSSKTGFPWESTIFSLFVKRNEFLHSHFRPMRFVHRPSFSVHFRTHRLMSSIISIHIWHSIKIFNSVHCMVEFVSMDIISLRRHSVLYRIIVSARHLPLSTFHQRWQSQNHCKSSTPSFQMSN